MSQGNNDTKAIYADPKTALIFTFNTEMQDIYKTLLGNTKDGGRKLLLFILRLNVTSEKDYEKMRYIQDHINFSNPTGYSILHAPSSPYRNPAMYNPRGMLPDEIMQIYRETNEYMGKTYFKGFEKGGKPQQPFNGEYKL